MSEYGADTWTGRAGGDVARDRDLAAGGPPVDSALVGRLRGEVTDRLEARLQADEAAGLPRMRPADQRQFGRQLISEALEAEARAAVAAGRSALDLAAEDAVAQAVADALFGLGRLQRLLDGPQIENINAQGCDQVFVRYADGTRARLDPIADSDAELVDLLRLAAARMGLGSGASTLARRGCRCSFPTAAGCLRSWRSPGGRALRSAATATSSSPWTIWSSSAPSTLGCGSFWARRCAATRT